MELILIGDYLFSNLAKIILVIFLLSKTRYFSYLIYKVEQSLGERLILIAIFSLLAILGNYNGLAIGEHSTNTRAIGIILGGLIGGPVVGTSIGILAGAHSWYLAEGLGYAPFLASVGQGYISGYLANNLINSPERWKYQMVGFGLETLHIFLLVALNPPFDQTMKIVRTVGPIMVLINGAGIAIVMTFIESLYGQRAQVRTVATRRALQIASNTLTNLQEGLTKTGANKIAENIMEKLDNIHSIAITSTKEVLAFKGGGEEHHCPENEKNNPRIFNNTINEVVETGVYRVYQTKEYMDCLLPGCPLSAVVVVPLKEFDKTIGTLMLFKNHEYSITKFDEEFAQGLGRLITSKLETSKNQRQTNLLAQAEINALQAQINPHFLFNALSTITYYCRTDPETARELIIHLSEYYRKNMIRSENLIPLEREIDHVNSYVRIEMARFGGKLQVLYNLEEGISCKIPPLVLQPLVENAIKHGLYPKRKGGIVTVSSHGVENCVLISVEDDGVGMDGEMTRNVLNYDTNRSSIGLSNVDSRLRNIFGEDYGLRISSSVNQGTRVEMIIPINQGGNQDDKDISG